MKCYNYLAVDVSKLSLQILTSTHMSLLLDYQDIDKILELVDDQTVVVFEATGGYERPLREFLQNHGIHWAMVHPAKIRSFAKACGIHAKTDKLDALVILQFAQKTLPLPQAQVDQHAALLAALMDRRSQIIEMIKQEKTRLQNSDPLLHKSLKKHLDYLLAEQKRIENSIRDHVAKNDQQQKSFDTICSVDGLGKASAWSLLAYLPELPRLQRNQAVCLAGLAPFNRDSGAHSGKRSIHGGRFKIRRALYMAAVVASRSNAHIAAYYGRLTAAGKPAKCALVAVMRKLLLHVRTLPIRLNSSTQQKSTLPLAS